MDEDQLKEAMREMARRGGSAKTSKRKGLAALSEADRKAISAAGVEARKKKKITLDNKR